MYVTFQIKPCEFARLNGYETKRYAVKCESLEQLGEVLSDANSIDGVTYLRVNKSKRKLKDRINLSYEEYHKAF